ncbi:MAG: hypothetical protein G01um101466_627 [Parcubacteria group bacterium Gr01-1014_66]|nr:MAG: hypothetical protein G01um101466_627 [Parcubacteria group bacterium Gr01-1014_66]
MFAVTPLFLFFALYCVMLMITAQKDGMRILLACLCAFILEMTSPFPFGLYIVLLVGAACIISLAEKLLLPTRVFGKKKNLVAAASMVLFLFLNLAGEILFHF